MSVINEAAAKAGGGRSPSVPATPGEMAFALMAGGACHLLFGLAVVAMIWAMAFGMSHGLGRAPPAWRGLANALLLGQFVITHSVLLGRRGGAVLKRAAPRKVGSRANTTTYALVASIQTLALFALWTPSGVVWWRASGPALAGLLALYAGAWLFLLKAIVDAGLGLQTGFLGWWAVARGRRPVFPPMPTTGLFRFIRQPIYLGFALTTWTVPVWTPDQLEVALALTAYCALGPLMKEARFVERYGEAFKTYRAATPYWWPWPRPASGKASNGRSSR